jgi:NAD(P)-dependent dehydrogenase (short-subunit alcohol dehydrogenase family)
MNKPYDGMRVILSGSKGNLGPIWKSILVDLGAEVTGFDWDYSKPTSLTNCDVRSNNSLMRFKEQYKSAAPDMIINNAAIDVPPHRKNVDFFTDAHNTVTTNLIGAINLTQLFVSDMITRGKGGLIINIGSIQGNVAADIRNYDNDFEKPVGYNVSKAGLIQFTRSLAVQYGKHNIRSVCLAFSAVDSGKFDEPFKSKFLSCLPLGKLISRQSLEASLRFAIDCPELTGQQVLIDSGYTAW